MDRIKQHLTGEWRTLDPRLQVLGKVVGIFVLVCLLGSLLSEDFRNSLLSRG
jgi:hypothetical protein